MSCPTRCFSALLALHAAFASAAEHHWLKRGGALTSNSYTSATSASSIEEPPSWTWKNALDEQVRHTPLIDVERNIYIQTAVRIRKFNPDGALLWTWEVNRSTDGRMNIAPVLHEEQILLATSWPQCAHGAVQALSTLSGQLVWRLPVTRCLTHDATSLFVENNVLVFGTKDLGRQTSYDDEHGGTNVVVGMQLRSKEELWTYETDDVVWNFMPSSVGDGTIMFSTSCGGVHRINLHTGALLWKAGRLGDIGGASRMCGCGGGVLGPNGKFYAEYNDDLAGQLPSTERAKVAAFEVSNGERLWERAFAARSFPPVTAAELSLSTVSAAMGELGGWQYPAVGEIDGRTVVVAPVGSITGRPPWPEHWPIPDWLKAMGYVAQLHVSWFRRYVWFAPSLQNEVVALDGDSGAVLWRYAMPIWDHWAPQSDEADVYQRSTRQAEDPLVDVLCLPDNQGIPLITGDGTVYASDSHRGELFAIKDKNKDGVIEESEVQRFVTNKEFLNGPSLAPGLLVAAPCWGDAYVWKD
mmetsp:Transcript_56723/g.135093  ORF Transcript_56723/g.135093 Transcript_56723/m.135093 type:complete len:525 (+) Transcript_56723:131-1705(+)